MRSFWDNKEAARFQGDLAQRVYTSRLLGRDPSLVLHGGGNTSVKIRERNLFGDEEEILYVKGSGCDLESIEESDFSPVRLAHLRRLLRLESVSDSQILNEFATHLTRAGARAPSVEALLHALLPHKFVDHTHADALLAVANTQDGEQRIAEIYGSQVVVVPYVMPGFDLARRCAELYPLRAANDTIGMVLVNHGVFSFGGSAKESYERMIQLVQLAEDYLARHRAWSLPAPRDGAAGDMLRGELAALRNEISASAGFPMVMRCHFDARSLSFTRRPDLKDIAQGPATPDHVIRTKRLPMIGRNVEAYAAAYRDYFNEHAPGAKEKKAMLDPAPRVVLDPELGFCALGRTAKDAAIVSDLYAHTMDVIERAELLGGFRALSAKDIFDVEYWDLEQAKLRKDAKPPVFAGEVALVTGAASGIGRACVAALLARGAAVVGLDLDPAIKTLHQRRDFLGIQCDVTREPEIRDALEAGVRAFGGLDMLVLNAGVFPAGTKLAALGTDEWRRVMQVNLDANFFLLRECHQPLRLAPRKGRVVIIGSKNVPAPGPGAAAYSASKAGVNQLARVAALEWGADGIRINTLHPDAVFDTASWTDEVLQARAAHYRMTVEEYKRRNVLKTDVRSSDVAELAAEMCGPAFAKTTGAQVPVDGGNERVI